MTSMNDYGINHNTSSSMLNECFLEMQISTQEGLETENKLFEV